LRKTAQQVDASYKGVARGAMPPKFLENIVILSFERRFSKQNRAIRLKSTILAPPKFLGWLRYRPVSFTTAVVVNLWVINLNLFT